MDRAIVGRLFFYVVCAYCVGIALSEFMTADNITTVAAVFVFIITAIVVVSVKTRYYKLLGMFVILFVFLGMIKLKLDLNNNPAKNFSDKNLTVIAQIISKPVAKEQLNQYVVRVKKLTLSGKDYDADFKVQMSHAQTTKTKTVFDYGDIIRFKTSLRLAKDALNSGGFNQNYYLRAKGIYATCYVTDNAANKIGRNDSLTLESFIFNSRQYIISMIDKSVPGDEGTYLKALMIGDRTDFSTDMTDKLSKAGISHVTAVSGMHVAIFLMVISYTLRTMGITSIPMRIVSILFVGYFVLLTGATPSIMRAGISSVLLICSYLINREADSLTSLAVSAAIILGNNSVILFNLSFQLSFASTLCIIIFRFDNSFIKFIKPRLLRDIAATSLSAQVGTVILIAYHFNNVSPVSLLNNLIIGPLVPVMYISGMLLCIFGNIFLIGNLISGFVYIIVKFVLWTAYTSLIIPFASIRVVSPNLFVICIYIVACFALYTVLNKSKQHILYYERKLIGCVLIVSVILLCCVTWHIYTINDLEVTFINVGQGDAALIRLSDKNILLDGGGSTSYDVGRSILIPYLLKKGVSSIDTAIVSHYHDDHANGIIAVLDELEVKNLFLPRGRSQSIVREQLEQHAQNTEIYYIGDGDLISLNDRISIDVFAPLEYYRDRMTLESSDENNSSLVTRLVYQRDTARGISFLFTGDIEYDGQQAVLESEYFIESDVLKVSHHGSRNGTGQDFLDAVNPKYAVINVGKNSFGHPAQQVLEILEQKNVITFRTDLNGDIVFTTDGNKMKSLKAYKQ